MHEYLFKSTKMFRKYNKINADGDDDDVDDGDAAIDGEDDAQASNDLSSSEDQCPSPSSPSRSLLEVKFLRVLVSTNVGFRSVCTG